MFVEDINKLFRINIMDNNSESKLRIILDRQGISPAEFGRMMGGVKSQTVNNWIKRGVPHGKAVQVASVLGVALSEVSQSNIDHVVPLTEASSNTAPKDLDEYVAIHSEQWKNMPPQDLAKLMAELSTIMQQNISASDD